MTQAKDEAFATCAMGDGVVIEPEKVSLLHQQMERSQH